MRSLALEHHDSSGQPDFRALENWRQQYDRIQPLSHGAKLSPAESESQKVSLAEIRQILVHRARASPTPPRIAVVLSGGGAKCSYQAGAVSALEEMLDEARRQHPDLSLDLNLIVGTSGGAINAVPIALGLLKEPAGRTEFRAVWEGLDQREILRPSVLFRTSLGIWFALLQIGIVLLVLRFRGFSRERRHQIFARVMLTLATVEVLLGYLHFSPWQLLGDNHYWHHLYLVCTLGIRTSAWILLVAGLLWLALNHWSKRRRSPLKVPRRPIGWILGICLAILPVFQIVTVLWFQETFSGGQGIEQALSENFPRLIDNTLARRSESLLDLTPAKSDAERLTALSRRVFSRDLFQRDLVITGNCIAQTSGSLPNDIYFYAGAGDSPGLKPDYGARGMNLAEYPAILMDVVMGSGTIFPVFPPRTVYDFPDVGDKVELIDGGFAHNSPVEAAVLWGATHIFLIEATPEKRKLRKNLLQNAATAIVHLHKQTQLVDMRSKQEVMVFTLTPEPPHICVLDFSSNLIRASIQRGYRDAGGGDRSTISGKRFRKELGKPVFTAVRLHDD